MKKILSLIGMLVLMCVGANALGMGVISTIEFGTVARGESYTKDLMFFPIDSKYIPYTDVVPDYQMEVMFTTTCDYMDAPVNVIADINTWTKQPVTLKIPKKAPYGVGQCQVCAIGINNVATGIGINVGACSWVNYDIEKPIRRFKMSKYGK